MKHLVFLIMCVTFNNVYPFNLINMYVFSRFYGRNVRNKLFSISISICQLYPVSREIYIGWKKHYKFLSETIHCLVSCSYKIVFCFYFKWDKRGH